MLISLLPRHVGLSHALNVSCCKSIPFIHIRTTYILKRRHGLKVQKYGEALNVQYLTPDDKVYDLVENTATKRLQPLKVLLLKPVAGIGLPGHVVDLKRNFARFQIIFPGLGVYASPENLKKYAYLADIPDEDKPSSPSALKMVLILESRCFDVLMNMESQWKIEPCHIRLAFRREGIWLQDSAITLPDRPIAGPDLSIEGKEFLVLIKINNRENARVRMRIHHISTEALNRIPPLDKCILREPIFPEEAHILGELNANDPKMVKPKD